MLMVLKKRNGLAFFKVQVCSSVPRNMVGKAVLGEQGERKGRGKVSGPHCSRARCEHGSHRETVSSDLPGWHFSPYSFTMDPGPIRDGAVLEGPTFTSFRR